MEHAEEITVDVHKSVGPIPEMYGHGPVTGITRPTSDDTPLWVCLDCGYVTTDNRQLAHEKCEREDNAINTTWREFLGGGGFPDQGEGGPFVGE